MNSLFPRREPIPIVELSSFKDAGPSGFCNLLGVSPDFEKSCLGIRITNDDQFSGLGEWLEGGRVDLNLSLLINNRNDIASGFLPDLTFGQ